MTSIELLTKLATTKATLKTATELCIKEGNKAVFTMYTKELGIKVKESNQIWKDASPVVMPSSSTGLMSSFRSWLAEADRTEKDVYNKVIEMGKEAKSISFIAYVGKRLDEWAMVEMALSRAIKGRTAGTRTIKGLTRVQAEAILNEKPAEKAPVKATRKTKAKKAA